MRRRSSLVDMIAQRPGLTTICEAKIAADRVVRVHACFCSEPSGRGAFATIRHGDAKTMTSGKGWCAT